jgi:hypothetical protein
MMAGHDTDHDVNWFASLSLKSGSCVIMAAFDFGSVIEEALMTLNLSETDGLKVKLISIVAKEEYWSAILQEISLSADVASPGPVIQYVVTYTEIAPQTSFVVTVSM